MAEKSFQNGKAEAEVANNDEGIHSVADAAIWLFEKLNLKFDHHLKGDLSKLDDEKLLALRRSAIRAVASSSTGIILNGALSGACPVFIGPVVISVWQLVVSAVNLRRVEREVQRRAVEEPRSQAKLRKRDILIDVAIGSTVKAAFVALCAGIVGFDTIGDNFTSAGCEHTAAAVKADHPHLAKVDHVVHEAVAGVGDKISKGMEHATQLPIDLSTGWEDLKDFVAWGASKALVGTQVALVGIWSELTLFLVQFLDVIMDEGLRFYHEHGWVEGRRKLWERVLKRSPPSK